MKYTIKKINSTDFNRVVEIVKESLKKDFPEYQLRTSLASQKIFNLQYFKELLKKKNNILGAYMEKNLIGFLAIRTDYGGVAYYDWFVMMKKFRCQGIGTRLLKAGEQWAIKHYYHYYHSVYLHTESQKNIDYYLKHGFRYVGVLNNFWFGEREHILQKTLLQKPAEQIFFS